MTFIIGIFQLHCKSKPKQVKGNEIKVGMCKSASATLFNWLLKTIFWQGLLQKWMLAVPKEKSPSFNFIL